MSTRTAPRPKRNPGREDSPAEPRIASARPIWRAAALIAVVVVGTYANALRAGFVYDDGLDVVENQAIRHLWPLWDVLLTRQNGHLRTLTRPAVNLTFAVDYALTGLEPVAFHLTNVGIHLAATLALFGVVRRTLLLPSLRRRFGGSATAIALVAALIWGVHPLNTEAVTYVTQRYESQMGLCFLLALYALARCASNSRPRLWAAAVVVANVLALASKEVAVSLPIVLLLYDRAFVAGSFPAALRQRRGMYLGLLGAWGLFFIVQCCAGSREAWAGNGLPVTSSQYALSQPGVILHYLRLAIWPNPLVLDYGWPVATTAGEILPGWLAIGSLFAASCWALVKRPGWGLLGAAFFLILAPTSSVLPLADLAVEHRMYLPLAALVVAAVLVGRAALEPRGGDRKHAAGRIEPHAGFVGIATGVIVLALSAVTWQRNRDYQSELTMMTDTVAKAPHNPRAHYNLGHALSEAGQVEQACSEYRQAIELAPRYAPPRTNLGISLMASGRFVDAVEEFTTVLALQPDSAEAENYLGLALSNSGQPVEAIQHFQRAISLRPQWAAPHINLAATLAATGQRAAALCEYGQALELDPHNGNAHAGLAELLLEKGLFPGAMTHCREALRLHASAVPLQRRLAWLLATSPHAEARSGSLALELAQEAARRSSNQDPRSLRALAAASAEIGQFREAQQIAGQALGLAERLGDARLVQGLKADQEHYQSGTAVRDMGAVTDSRP